MDGENCIMRCFIIFTLHEIDPSSDWSSQEDETVGNAARMRETKNSYNILIGKPEWKILLET